MVTISKYYSSVTKIGVRPSNPGNVVTVIPEVLNPADSPVNHSPVTIGSPANGLSLVGQELSLALSSSGVTGALSGTDWNTFNGKLNLTSPITGYVIGANTALAATDTILGAFGKIQGQIGARVSGTIASGQVAFGTGVNTVGGSNGLTLVATTNTELTIKGITGQAHLILRDSTLASYFSILTNASRSFFTASGSVNFRAQASGSIIFQTTNSNTTAWTILNDGTLEGNGAQTIRTSTGNLTLLSGAGNGNILLTPNGTGGVGIGTTPTNTLDVNGTTRIRTISNAVGNFLTTSATGVVQQRTAGETLGDIGANAALSTDINNALTGANLPSSTNVIATMDDISDASGVQTVTGTGVDNTDPFNPIINLNSDFTASSLPVAFDIPRKYGFTTAITGNITFGITGAFESSMAKILHNDTVAPTITGTGGVTVVNDGGTYVVSVDNIIYLVCHKNDSGTVTKVSYTITQNQP